MNPLRGSVRSAAKRSGEIYLRWERSSSEISAMAEMLGSNASDNDEATGKTGLRIVVALNGWECIAEIYRRI